MCRGNRGFPQGFLQCGGGVLAVRKCFGLCGSWLAPTTFTRGQVWETADARAWGTIHAGYQVTWHRSHFPLWLSDSVTMRKGRLSHNPSEDFSSAVHRVTCSLSRPRTSKTRGGHKRGSAGGGLWYWGFQCDCASYDRSVSLTPKPVSLRNHCDETRPLLSSEEKSVINTVDW